jgi:uncharacterized protein (TIGR03089 family)
VTPAQLLERRLRDDASSPLITYYDDATGERTEVSASTFATWVAKFACLLSEEDIEQGDDVAVALPAHWQTVVAVHAAWRVGAAVRWHSVEGAVIRDRVICDEAALDDLPAGARPLALSLRPLGAAMHHQRPGVVDLATELPGQPDRCDLPQPAGATTGLVDGAQRVALDALGGQVEALAEKSRVMLCADTWDTGQLLLAALGPLLCAGSLVICRHADPGVLERRASVERVTLTR